MTTPANDAAPTGLAGTTGSGIWIDANEKPPTGKKVLVCGHYENGNRWRTIARWFPAGTLDATMWDDPPDEWWDESGNRCTCPHDAWWEETVDTPENGGVLDHVTHWMTLPDFPNTGAEGRREPLSTKPGA